VDPASITVIVSAIVAGIVGGWKGKSVRVERAHAPETPAPHSVWESRIDHLQSSLQNDHENLSGKVDGIATDVTSLKVDVASIKAEIEFLKRGYHLP